MKILVIGASGTVGKGIVENLRPNHEVIRVGRQSGDLQVDLTNDDSIQQLFSRSGNVDAIVAATGSVHFAPLGEMKTDEFAIGLQDKLMGQVRLVMIGKDYLNPGGSFTLTSGILAQHAIRGGVSAMAVNRALEGFVQSAAFELAGLRINAVSPTVLTEALESYGPFFPGFESATAARVALAYRRSIEGIETGQVFRVW
ncbi:short chain dehydrogenase [Izhakiella australiensis]|uniref:Short chain dehydrogenase n=1 Tax=Izhakiella australiensis TaxID=1926881 RepID=A0A1S8YII6_9GAMM|nr:short chain dehydrogenase [Izhakiella australiensis]OON38523.1 short chain dehydrogenase [Izhakiella australiensis]